MSKLVTAIVPTYNRAHFLPRALQSIAKQDHRPIEVIVIDDGSTDNTADLIPAQQAIFAAAGIPLTFLPQKNGGPARARNAGLERANGQYIACLDSDDLWKPAFLSTMQRLLEAHPTAGLAFGGYLCIDADDQFTHERPTGLPSEPREGLMRKPFPGIMRYMPTGTPCIMIPRRVLLDVGYFDAAFHIGEDWDLWYRIGKKYDFAYTLEGLTCCRDHPENMQKGDSGAIADKVRLILKHLPDVHDQADRDEQIDRMQFELVLLQEQLLREKRQANGLMPLLTHELAPRSMRFKLGAIMRRQPKWVGRAYAKLIRTFGSLQRSKAPLSPEPNPKTPTIK